jgi:hypothetical protein
MTRSDELELETFRRLLALTPRSQGREICRLIQMIVHTGKPRRVLCIPHVLEGRWSRAQVIGAAVAFGAMLYVDTWE